MPCAQDCESGGNQLCALGVGSFDYVAFEAAKLWLFYASVEATEQCAPDRIFGDFEIVTGGTEQRRIGHLNQAAESKLTHVNMRFGDGLTQ